MGTPAFSEEAPWAARSLRGHPWHHLQGFSEGLGHLPLGSTPDEAWHSRDRSHTAAHSEGPSQAGKAKARQALEHLAPGEREASGAGGH